MGTWTRPNNRSSVVIDGMTFNIGDLMGAGLDPFDNLSSRAVMDALARHNQAKNIFNLNPLFLGTRPEDTYQEEVVDLNADTTASDLLSTIDPSLASVAANTGPFVTDPDIADVDDKETGLSSKTPEAILAEYSNKDRADPVTDMLGDYKQEDGTNFPVNVLLEIISDYAINRNNKDAQVILGKWNDKVAARKEDILDADAAANNQAAAEAAAARNQAGADAAAQQTSDGNTDTGLKADNAAGGVGGAGNVPASGADTTVGGAGNDTLTGGNGDDTINNDNDTDKDISVISGGSVLDQTGTGNVNVDDQPKGFLTGMTPQAQAIINEGNRYDITATMLGPLIAKQDVPIISPLQFELDNVKQSPLSTALLFSNGLMGSFV
jgi:hypothetical protein